MQTGFRRLLTATLGATLILAACGPRPHTAERGRPQPDEPIPARRPPSISRVSEAADTCLLPVINGRPTDADYASARRMVSGATVIPGEEEPWLLGYNRRGQWTIDAAGRYVRFPGRKVGDFELSFVREATTGRVITAADEELLTLTPGRGFAPIAKVSDNAGHTSISLLRVERLDLTLVITRSAVQRLRGDVVEPWAESDHVDGAEGIQAVDLPALHAVLFSAADGALKLRRDDGRWETLGRREYDGHDYWLERVEQSESSSTTLIWMRQKDGPRYRPLGMFGEGSNGSVRLLDAGPYDHRSGSEILFTAATGEILRFQQPSPGRLPAWSRLTATGYEPIPGGLAPAREGDGFRLRPVDLPRRHAMVFDTKDGLAIYHKGRMRLIPGPAPAGLGALPKIVDLPAVGRTLIVSRHGLFELPADDRIIPVAAPFSTGGLPPLSIFDDERRGLAVIHAAEGLFTLDRRGVYRRIQGPRLGEPGYDEHVATLSVSGDQLLTLDNALWLLVSPASTRWSICRAQRGVTANEQTTRNAHVAALAPSAGR